MGLRGEVDQVVFWAEDLEFVEAALRANEIEPTYDNMMRFRQLVEEMTDQEAAWEDAMQAMVSEKEE